MASNARLAKRRAPEAVGQRPLYIGFLTSTSGHQTIGLANAPQGRANGRWHFFVFNWKGSLLGVHGRRVRSLDTGYALESDAVDEFRVGINVATLVDNSSTVGH